MDMISTNNKQLQGNIYLFSKHDTIQFILLNQTIIF